MQDEHPRVRYAALSCVGQMTQDFGDWDGGAEEEGGGGSFQGAFHAQVRAATAVGGRGEGVYSLPCMPKSLDH